MLLQQVLIERRNWVLEHSVKLFYSLRLREPYGRWMLVAYHSCTKICRLLMWSTTECVKELTTQWTFHLDFCFICRSALVKLAAMTTIQARTSSTWCDCKEGVLGRYNATSVHVFRRAYGILAYTETLRSLLNTYCILTYALRMLPFLPSLAFARCWKKNIKWKMIFF